MKKSEQLKKEANAEDNDLKHMGLMRATGYFSNSCADICKEMSIQNHQLYVVENYLDEFKQFIEQNHKVLKKHHKPDHTDYSPLAYNGVTDDF